MDSKKIAIMAVVAVAVLAILAGMFLWGNGEKGDGKVAVTGVTLDVHNVIMDVGVSADLTCEVSPANATNKAVYWSTSDASVVTVDNGKIKAVKAGEATVKVRTVDGGYTDVCNVTVNQPVVDPTVSQYVDAFLSKYDGSFGDFAATTAEDGSVELKSQGNLRTRVPGVAEPAKTRESVMTVYGYDTAAAAEKAFNDFLANSKNGSKGETILSQTDKVGMASTPVKLIDLRESGAKAYGADKAYLLYGSYYKEANNGYTQCVGAIQDGTKVAVFNKTIDSDLYYSLPISSEEHNGIDSVSQADYEAALFRFVRSLCDESYVPAADAMSKATKFLSKCGTDFGVLMVDSVDENGVVTLSTLDNVKTKVDGVEDPSKTRDFHIKVYHLADVSAAAAKFADLLEHSKNGTKGETILSQTDKVGMVTTVNLKDLREGGAGDYGADKVYLLYGTYYKQATNGYTQCVGEVLDGCDILVFNETTNFDLYLNLPMYLSSDVGSNYVTEAQYDEMLKNFVKAF